VPRQLAGIADGPLKKLMTRGSPGNARQKQGEMNPGCAQAMDCVSTCSLGSVEDASLVVFSSNASCESNTNPGFPIPGKQLHGVDRGSVGAVLL
jgi:hypothetical protein